MINKERCGLTVPDGLYTVRMTRGNITMKKSAIRRLFSAAAACSVMISALPALPTMTTLAAGNIITNSTFESGTSGWGTY